MGKIKKSGLFIILFITLILIVRYIVGSPNSAEFRVFSQLYSGYHHYKFLGIVPEKIKKNFQIRILDAHSNKELVSLSDTVTQPYFDFLILKDIKVQKDHFLKAYPISLIASNKQKVLPNDWGELTTLMIDLKVFNVYVKEKKIASENEIIAQYFYFLSDLDNPDSFKVLQSQDDIKRLMEQAPSENVQVLNNLGYKEFTQERFQFNDKYKYCWFSNKGVLQFEFHFNDDESLREVNAVSLGFLGFETPIVP